jgi:uncharacterized protein (TIGR02271 family)
MPQETIVAVFETNAHADEAVRALTSAGVPADAIERRAKNSQTAESGRGAQASPPSTGFFFWDIMFGAQSSHQDRSLYERSVDRGQIVIAVTVPERQADEVMSVLENCSPVALDENATKDESAEPAPADRPRAEASANPDAPIRQTGRSEDERKRGDDVEEDEDSGRTETTTEERESRRSSGEEEEQVIPLAEEELRVGKRTINRGTTRIRRYVVETPVERPVSLRDERVVVERRKPVTDSATGDALTEKTIEVTETSEAPVTDKVARLKEEVVVRREGRERDETVRDTVRRDEIAVEDAPEAPPRSNSRSAS